MLKAVLNKHKDQLNELTTESINLNSSFGAATLLTKAGTNS